MYRNDIQYVAGEKQSDKDFFTPPKVCWERRSGNRSPYFEHEKIADVQSAWPPRCGDVFKYPVAKCRDHCVDDDDQPKSNDDDHEISRPDDDETSDRWIGCNIALTFSMRRHGILFTFNYDSMHYMIIY